VTDPEQIGPARPEASIAADRSWEALRFAERRYRGLVRPRGRTPYLDHVAAVAGHVIEIGGSDALVCAAYLHDLVEDGGADATELLAHFGDEIAGLVLAVTDVAADPDTGAETSWSDRRRAGVRLAREASYEVSCLKACDLWANVDELLIGHARHGIAIFDHYAVDARRQIGYYVALADVLMEHLDHPRLRHVLGERRHAMLELADREGIKLRKGDLKRRRVKTSR
jgi:(p)ppGpp synthase/HD superfamily hydrolase